MGTNKGAVSGLHFAFRCATSAHRSRFSSALLHNLIPVVSPSHDRQFPQGSERCKGSLGSLSAKAFSASAGQSSWRFRFHLCLPQQLPWPA